MTKYRVLEIKGFCKPEVFNTSKYNLGYNYEIRWRAKKNSKYLSIPDFISKEYEDIETVKKELKIFKFDFIIKINMLAYLIELADAAVTLIKDWCASNKIKNPIITLTLNDPSFGEGLLIKLYTTDKELELIKK